MNVLIGIISYHNLSVTKVYGNWISVKIISYLYFILGISKIYLSFFFVSGENLIQKKGNMIQPGFDELFGNPKKFDIILKTAGSQN